MEMDEKWAEEGRGVGMWEKGGNWRALPADMNGEGGGGQRRWWEGGGEGWKTRNRGVRDKDSDRGIQEQEKEP